jgi:hypothetical protein
MSEKALALLDDRIPGDESGLDSDAQGSDSGDDVRLDRGADKSLDAQRSVTGTLPAESLALVTGLFPTKAPTASDVARATKLLHKVEMSIKRMLKGARPEKWESWQRPPAQDRSPHARG